MPPLRWSIYTLWVYTGDPRARREGTGWRDQREASAAGSEGKGQRRWGDPTESEDLVISAHGVETGSGESRSSTVPVFGTRVLGMTQVCKSQLLDVHLNQRRRAGPVAGVLHVK